MYQVVMTKQMQFKIVNPRAALGRMIPEGISLTTVRSFIASISRSAQRLKAIAAERAKTIHNTTCRTNQGLKVKSTAFAPARKPISAKGKAKTVWLNLMRER